MSDSHPSRPTPDDLASEISKYAERVRKLHLGLTSVIDLRGADDVAQAASDAIAAQETAARDVDQFVIDAVQEMELYGNLGQAKLLFGYPVHVAYEFAED